MIPVPVPYIGITGIVTDEDVETVRECVQLVENGTKTHRFMAGVLVSHKTLTGRPTTNRRYPLRTGVESLLSRCMCAGAWPVIHYNTQSRGLALAHELQQLSEDFPSMRGLQLNVVCPDPDVVREFASDPFRRVEVILQINHTSLVKTAVAPAKIGHPCDYAKDYVGISHALIDASGGNGRLFDHRTADTILETLPTMVGRGVSLGLAGGLGPDCGSALDDLRTGLLGHGGDEDVALDELSFDAESRVRVPVPDPIEGEKYQDMLDRTRAIEYVRTVCSKIRG